MALVAAGCAAPEQDALWALRDDAMTVLVDRDPYRLSVWAGGELLLRTLGDGEGDGYASVALADGEVQWGSTLSPGWFQFTPQLQPWQDAWVVVDAALDAEDQTLDLVLVAPSDADDWAGDTGGVVVPAIEISHELDDGALRVRARRVNDDDPRAWSVGFESPASEGFLGFGERFNRTDQRGVDLYAWAEEGGVGLGEGPPPGPDNPTPNGQAMTYYPVPFHVSTRGYGFWLDTTHRSEANLATDRDDAWRTWHIGPELVYEVYAPIPDDPRPWPYHLIDRFTARTGRPALPPPWAFGPRRRIGRNNTVEGVDEIQKMRDDDLAITAVDDAVHFLPGGSHVGVEAELAAWTARAAELGYRVNGYYNPYFTNDPDGPLGELVTEGLDQGYFLLDEDGDPSEVWLISGDLVWVLSVDFTVGDAARFHQDALQWAIDLGYSGFMLDFGEYVQPDVLSGAGLGGEELHNLYPVLYQRAVTLAMDGSERGNDWLYFARSGYTGSSAWAPFVWSGDPAASFDDADGLPSVVRAAINLGVSGAPHSGSDIGGFHCVSDGSDAADGELLARWIEVGALMSNMQDQDACIGDPGDGEKASIWTSSEARLAWKTYARLHTRLFPYFYGLAIDAINTGAPTVRHLFLEHPDQPELRGVDDQWYLGPSLLVAPVVERDARARSVVLPAGSSYLDWRDHALYDGGQTVTVDAPLVELPLLLRSGGIVPLLDDTVDTLASESRDDVISSTDVDDRYDVVGLLEVGDAAAFDNWAGGALGATYTGAFAPGDLVAAADEGELRRCDGCYRVDALDGVVRVRVSSTAEALTLGGLTLTQTVGRRVRWDLFLRE